MTRQRRAKTIIITSSITRVEVLDCKIPPGGEARYLKFLRREIVQEYDVDPRIASAAHDIRAHYRKLGRDLGVADAIHIATACLREVPQMLTLDGTGNKIGPRVSGVFSEAMKATIERGFDRYTGVDCSQWTDREQMGFGNLSTARDA